MKLDKRTRWLSYALAGVVILAIASKIFNGSPEPGGVPSRESGRRLAGRSQVTEQALITEVVEVALDALQPAPASFQPGRDPFRFGAKAPPPRPAITPKPVTQTVRPESTGPPPVQGPVPPSFAHLKFLGSFGPERHRIAVVVDGEETHNLSEGEILDGKFVVEKIGYETVEIGFVGFDDASPEKLEVGGGRETG